MNSEMAYSKLSLLRTLYSNQMKLNQLKSNDCLVFEERGNMGIRREPTSDTRSGIRPWVTLVGGEGFHHCANPASFPESVHQE